MWYCEKLPCGSYYINRKRSYMKYILSQGIGSEAWEGLLSVAVQHQTLKTVWFLWYYLQFHKAIKTKSFSVFLPGGVIFWNFPWLGYKCIESSFLWWFTYFSPSRLVVIILAMRFSHPQWHIHLGLCLTVVTWSSVINASCSTSIL